MNDEKKKDIGALWNKRSTKGTEYLSGYVEINGQKVSVVCFANGHKKEAKHPDYKVYLSEPREKQAAPPAADTSAFDRVVDEVLTPEKPKTGDDYGLAGVTF